jgi:hypothetical protein
MALRFKEPKVKKNENEKGILKQKDRSDTVSFYGKSYFFPIMLFALGVLSAVTAYQADKVNYFYYFTFIAYFGLSVFYFIKKPYLRIGKDFISTRRMGADRIMEADQIDHIEIYESYVLFVFKKKRTKWVFAKIINKYPVADIVTALIPFAKANKIKIVDERSSI